MKTRLTALAGMLVLSLITSVAWAQQLGAIQPTGSGVVPIEGGVLRGNCPAGTTEFKDQFPSLTDGPTGGTTSKTYSVFNEATQEYDDVTVNLKWYGPGSGKNDPDNSIDFKITSGVVPKFFVKAGQAELLYEYSGCIGLAPGVDPAPNCIADTGLNLREFGAQDASHIDLCLAAFPDTTPPDVTITEPADGATVSGVVSVKATVSDNVELMTVGADANGASLGDPAFTSPDKFVWTWDTKLIPNDDYTITVTATDTAGNTTTRSITVKVVTALGDCLEGLDGVPDGKPSADGCNKTGFLQLEYPEELRDKVENFIVTQAVIPAHPLCSSSTPSPEPCVDETASCQTDQFPLVVQDPRVGLDGAVIAIQTLDLATLFDIEGHYADFHPGVPVPEAILRENTVGSPCLALIHQDAPAFSELTIALPNGGVYTVTQFPEFVPGMYEGLARITAPLNYCDPTDADCDTLPACFGDPAVQCAQPDPQFVEQAANQPDYRWKLVKPFAAPFTYDVYNASRTKGFDGTFFPLNTREVCVDLDLTLTPGTAAYFDAVYQCKINLALEYAEDTRLAIEQANARGNLLSPSVNTLYNWLNRAQGQIKNEHFERCLQYVQKLENEIVGGTWTVDEFNDPGRLVMYSRNLYWRCDQLLLDEAN